MNKHAGKILAIGWIIAAIATIALWLLAPLITSIVYSATKGQEQVLEAIFSEKDGQIERTATITKIIEFGARPSRGGILRVEYEDCVYLVNTQGGIVKHTGF